MSRHNLTIWTLWGVAMVTLLVVLLRDDGEIVVAPQWEDTYSLTARFGNVSGVKVGTAVSIAGIEIGYVSALNYDPQSYEAVMTIAIGKEHNYLPADSSAAIYSHGLMGERYVAIEPGGAEEMLVDGDEITLTQSSVILEQLIGQFLFSQATDAPK